MRIERTDNGNLFDHLQSTSIFRSLFSWQIRNQILDLSGNRPLYYGRGRKVVFPRLFFHKIVAPTMIIQ